MERKPGESFADYKARRAESNKKPEKKYVFVSKDLPTKDKDGKLVWGKGRTYLNPDKVVAKTLKGSNHA